MKPLVSVIIPVYNAQKYICEALKSIINQTYSNLEVIIIDDGSTDNSLEIITKYQLEDSRVKILKNNKNMGLIYSLNKGIVNSNGKYIARMDADDISYLTRIEKQVNFMEKNTDVCMCGTECKLFLGNKKFLRKNIEVEIDYEKIIASTLFKCEFIHPSIMIRRDIINENNYKYDSDFNSVEDYELWSRILINHKVTNIKESLLLYRVLKTSITSNANKNMELRKKTFKKLYKNYISNLGLKLNDEELDIHFEIAMIQNLSEINYSLDEKNMYLEKLIKNINKRYIKEVCSYQFLKCCIYENNYKAFKNSEYNNIINCTFLKFYYFIIFEKTKKIIKSIFR